MKIRTDFVTNSSSSSFVVIKIQSKTFAEIIKEHEEYIAENLLSVEPDFEVVDGENVELFFEDSMDTTPSSLEDFIYSLASVFSYNVGEDEDTQIAYKIVKNKDAIMEDLQSVDWTYEDIGYGGDNDLRYYEDSYPEHRLKEIKEIIAEDKGVPVEEISEEDFCDYVSPQTSHEVVSFKYDKETGEEHTKDFYLED